MSSITYHFGGKEGLYLAAADRIAHAIGERQAPALAAARSAPVASRDDAITTYLSLLDSFAAMMLEDQSAAWARFIIREQFDPTEAFDRIWAGMMGGIAGMFVALISRIRDDLDDREVRALTVTMIGQAIVLRAGRAAVCRILQVDRLGDVETDLLRARLRANALILLEVRR